MTTELDPREQTRALIAEILEMSSDKLAGQERLREDLGMDSLASMELLSSISTAFKLDLEPEDAAGIDTVDDACAFVASRLSLRESARADAR
jgi:acyl carrier protein